MSKPVVLTIDEWSPASVKYMAPKINERGGKSISLVSKQTNRALCFSTPLMMTWGISDFVDSATGESDGKYTLSLNFPNDEYATAATNKFLEKLKAFENQIIDDAVAHSEVWWGQEMSREIVKFNFFSFLKYSKNKDTKKTDFTKPPSIRAKVPHYDNKWAVEIYDTKSNLIFPCDNEHVTPMDLIPKLSSVACVLQCGGLWIGGKGWGLTWKLIQCVVKPKEVVSVYGKCHIQLSPEEKETIDSQQINEDVADENSVSDYIAPNVVAVPKAIAAPAPVVNTHVEDSDGEDNDSAVAPAPVAPAPMKKIVKKVSEIAATPPPAPVTEPVAETAAPTIVKKKVVKKVT
jgi:hypothetical protein